MDFLVVLIHLIICIVIFPLMKQGKIKSSMVVYPAVVLVPVCGLVLLVIEEYRARNTKQKERQVGVESFKISDIRYKRIEVDDDSNETITVPLEEAISVNNASVRRKLMMDILHRNPEEFIELLQMTRTADDTELTHYATTTMMEIQNKYELEIHKLSEEIKENPKELQVLKKYRKVLLKYIDSGLISGKILEIYRAQLDDILRKLCEMLPENRVYFQDYIRNQIALGKNDNIDGQIMDMINRWPDGVQVYQIYVEFLWKSNRGDEIPGVLNRLKEGNVYLSSEGKAWLEFWEQKDL